jgi:membrane associated rhomboid family serine protease
MDERPGTTDTTVCYRHPDRPTRLTCSRCGRPICAECSRDAAVGQHCPDCAAPSDRHQVVRARNAWARPTFQTAPVSFFLIGISLVVFGLGYVSLEVEARLFLNLAQFNALVAAGEWWRVFTAALLHGGIGHIFFNMYALYIFGPRLETQVGSPSFAALYVAAAGAGGAVSYVFGAFDQVSVGASGAIFGLFGAWLFAAFKMRGSSAGRSMFNQLAVLLAINLALPLLIPNIDWRAHLGGLLAGIGIAWLWSLFAAGRPNAVAIRTAIAVGVIALDLAVVLLV